MRQLTADGEVELDDATRAEILATAEALARDALRVLAVSRRQDATVENAESELTFLGLLGMIDPPRPEAADAVETCARAGITAVMITGDHPADGARRSLANLASSRDGRVVTGAELEAMSDTELTREIDGIEVYARVSPRTSCGSSTPCRKRGTRSR